MTAFILTLGALAILATASKATPRKWVALLAICVLLLAGCSAGGADGYYNDTPGATHSQTVARAQPVPQVIQVAPTAQPTQQPPPQPIEGASAAPAGNPPSKSNGTVMLGDDYAANVAASLGGCVLSPFAFFLFAYAIGGTVMRRYGLLPIRGTPNE